MIPEADKIQPSYENFVAECPWCRKMNNFNRASDLKTFEPIAGRDVSCEHADCGKPFRIVGDSVNSAHEMLVFDCYELFERKHFMSCILNLAQAYEVFFGLVFRVDLLFKPWAADPENDLDELNRLSDELYEKLKNHTFERMRALFLQHMVTGRGPSDLAEAAAAVAALPERPGDPTDSAIDSSSNPKLVPLLRALKATSINTLRNHVVHKHAYRPTRDEVGAALKETRSILFPLTSHLGLHGDINWYMRKT